MKSSITNNVRRPYLMAVVLGTAIAAAGPEAAQATEISPKAITNISRYCTACWRNGLPEDQWGDCTQEVLCRLLKNLPARSWEQVMAQESEERREFVRAIDAVKKRHQRSRWQSAPTPELVADSRDERTRSRADQREAVREACERVLSDRQQHILNLITDGHRSEIASELKMSQSSEDEKYKAIQKLCYFRNP